MKRATSTVDTTRTTTSTSSKTAAARRGPRILTGPTVVEIAASHWACMSMEERDTYAALTAEMANSGEPKLPGKRAAYNTFVLLSAANIAAGKQLDTTALPYAPCPLLPDITVTASYANKTLTLTLTPSAAYPHPIAIKACLPLLASDFPTTATKFKKIGAVADFSGAVDITPLFNSRYRVPGTGMKVALEIMGVAPGGFHTQAKLVCAVINAPAAVATLTAPQDVHLQAA